MSLSNSWKSLARWYRDFLDETFENGAAGCVECLIEYPENVEAAKFCEGHLNSTIAVFAEENELLKKKIQTLEDYIQHISNPPKISYLEERIKNLETKVQ